jgi:uncharacterized protein
MEIEREIINDLTAWKVNPYRKPLVLQGTRQVGKSWVMEKFGKTMFQNYVRVNFDGESELKADFARTKDPKRIIRLLSQVSGQEIKPQETLIIWDEIQECNEALNALKYFCEDAPEYAIVCAGSLLGVAMKRNGSSFPVGKVDFMTLYPLSFKEFLKAYDIKQYNWLSDIHSFEAVPEVIHTQLIESYKVYLACGGMPEAVSRYLDTKDWGQTETVIQNILKAYPLDFSKHINNKDIPRVYQVWNNLQDQLAKEDRKFKYGLVQKNARAREYESAIEWLCLSGLVHRVYNVQTPRLPVSAYKDSSAFKLYLTDAGLLRSRFGLDAQVAIKGDILFTEFKGILTENYVLQSLVQQFGDEQFYWTSGNQAEIEFLLPFNRMIIPIEAKSSINVKAKSLSEYRKKYSPEMSVRFSLRNMQKEGDLLNIPLYLVDSLKDLITSLL